MTAPIKTIRIVRQGPAGPVGRDGNPLLYGAGAPSNALGNDGDFYFDQTNSLLYGPKASGAWPGSYISLIGPQGPQGVQGPPGPQGASGPQGAQGPQGIAGPLAADVTTEDVAATTYTIAAGDLGKRKRTTAASAVIVTLPNDREQGFSILLCQAGAGQVTFSPAAGATLRNRAGYTKTAGQWSEVSLTVDANSGGSAAVWVLSGDVGP